MAEIIMLALFAVIFGFLSKSRNKIVSNNLKYENSVAPPWVTLSDDEDVIINGKKCPYLSIIGAFFILLLILTLIFICISTFDFWGIIGASISGFFTILLGIMYFSSYKSEICVTTRRIIGITLFGKHVDLPVDSISAVGTSFLNGFDISTSSGYIRFKFIENNNSVRAAVSQLLTDRQTNSVPQNVVNVPISNADELKKYKELLDSGIITQEEFDAKKKQLLGL